MLASLNRIAQEPRLTMNVIERELVKSGTAIGEVQREWNTNGYSQIEIPPDLEEQIEEIITDSNRSWDSAILEVALPLGGAKPIRKPIQQKHELRPGID